MTEFETLLMCFLIPCFAAVFYVSGKGDILNLIVLMLQEKQKEIEEILKEDGEDEAPKVEAVEVVRCKKCRKRYDPNECPMCILVYGEQHDFTHAEGYCDRGERKDNDST